MITGFVSDIHEDLKNLEKAFRILYGLNCDEVICLGDISGFSTNYLPYERERDASNCLKLLRDNCSIIIPGNHDLFACRKIPVNNPGFDYPDDWYSLDITTREATAENKIWLYEKDEAETNYSEEDKEFIRSLPEMRMIDIDGIKTLLSHHLYPDISGSSTRLLPDGDLELGHLKFMQENDCRLSFFGHNHVEGIWEISENSSKIKSRISVSENLTAVGLPCISRGSNIPGISWFDSSRGIIQYKSLEPKIKRFKLM